MTNAPAEQDGSNQSCERVYHYSKPKILFELFTTLITVLIALSFTWSYGVDMLNNGFKFSYLMILSMSIFWIMFAVYGSAFTIALLKSPFALMVRGNDVVVETVLPLMLPKLREISFDRSLLLKSTVYQFGIMFREQVPVILNGKESSIGKVLLLWRFVENGKLVSSEFKSLGVA